jgi:tetratricopeptide (TPR) repeat protein
LKLFPCNFNVALSLDFQEGLNSGHYFNEIKKNIMKLIDYAGLRKHIHLKDVSTIKKINNKKEAETFALDKMINMIIWGGFSSNHLKIKGEQVSRITLHFTYCHLDTPEQQIKIELSKDISTKFSKKNYWQIVESDSMRDVEIVSNNIFDISTYILAVILFISGRVKPSKDLFEQLYQTLDTRNDSFKEDIIPHLIKCYDIFLIEYYYSAQYTHGKKIAEKILVIDNRNIIGLSNLALFQWKLGEKDDAEKTIFLLVNHHPQNPITHLDLAFIRIMQKKYSNAYKHYKKMIHRSPVFNSQQVVDFLINEYEMSSEPSLLYSVGLVSFYFGDRDLGKEYFKLFLDTGDENIYKPMYRDASKLLSV